MLHVFALVIGKVHKSVDIFRGPNKISLPLYHTSTLSLWNTTMHPALHNRRIPKSKVIARCGMMWPTNGWGRPGTTTSHVWVDLTWQPLGRLTVSGLVAGCLFGTSTLSLTKTDVALVSGIPCASLMSIFLVCRAKLAIPRKGGRDKMFDVITVMLSSLPLLQAKSTLVGSRGAETKSLNLCDMLSSAPPRHVGGNWVLCCPFVLDPYTPYNAAFSQVDPT